MQIGPGSRPLWFINAAQMRNRPRFNRLNAPRTGGTFAGFGLTAHLDRADRRDGGMVQPSQHFGLPLKAGQRLVIFGNIVGQKLQGDESI